MRAQCGRPLGARLPGDQADATRRDPETEAPTGDVASALPDEEVSHGPRIIGGKKEKVILGQIEVLPRL